MIDINKVATLARLRLQEETQESIHNGFIKTMAFIEQLNEVDTTDIEPLASVSEVTLPLRVDAVSDGNYPDAIISNAPNKTENPHFFVVPKAVE